jgi:hypothetical protein
LRRAATAACLAVAVVLAAGGCLERTVSITSDPPGAIVRMNDVEVGRTPITTEFTYYGVYDVRLNREGQEPLRVNQRAWAPIYEYPPFDLVATILPVPIRTKLQWHYELEPEKRIATLEDEAALIERARGLGEMANSK